VLISSRLVAISSAAIFALVLGSAPAPAESWRGHDARGDVRSYRIDLQNECEEIPAGEPAPHDERRDITRLSVDHGAEDVVIDMGLRDVVRHDRNTSYEAYVHTPNRIFQVSVLGLSSKGPTVLISTVRVGRDPECGPALVGGHVVDCEAVVSDVDPRADHVSITIPRTCLGTPRWVRVGALAGGFDADQFTEDPTSITVTADIWGPAGARLGVLLPPSGPRVRPS